MSSETLLVALIGGMSTVGAALVPLVIHLHGMAKRVGKPANGRNMAQLLEHVLRLSVSTSDKVDGLSNRVRALEAHNTKDKGNVRHNTDTSNAHESL